MVTEVKCLTFPEDKKEDLFEFNFFSEPVQTGIVFVDGRPKEVLELILPGHYIGSYLGVHPGFIKVVPTRGYLHIDQRDIKLGNIDLQELINNPSLFYSRRGEELDKKARRSMVSSLLYDLKESTAGGIFDSNKHSQHREKAYSDLLSVLTGRNITEELIRKRFSKQDEYEDQKSEEDFKKIAYNQEGWKAFKIVP